MTTTYNQTSGKNKLSSFIPKPYIRKHDTILLSSKGEPVLILKKRNPMTQIVGIICKDAIVVACESQYTIDTRRTTGESKMCMVKFANGEALIACAGSERNSSRVVKVLREISISKKINSEWSVAETAEQAILTVRHEILNKFQDKDYTLDEQNEFFLRDGEICMFLLAHYFNEQPLLHTIRLDTGAAEKEGSFASVGSATELARFVLKEYDCAKLSWREAATLAVDAVDRINLDDIYCGGEIELASIDLDIGDFPHVRFAFSGFTERIIKKLRALRSEWREREKKDFLALMKEIHEENWEKFKATLSNEEDPVEKIFKSHEKR